MPSAVVFRYSPLIDKKQRVAGLRLALDGKGAAREAARALQEAAPHWPDELPVFVKMAPHMVGTELTSWTPPQGTVVEFSAASDLEWMGAWKGEKPTFCAAVSEEAPKAGGYEYLTVPVESLGSNQSESLKNACRTAKWVATGAESPRTFTLAMLRGAHSASGWHFLAPPENAAPKKSLANAANVLKLLELVNRDADVAEIEAILKTDVVIAYKLVSLCNSAAMGLSVEIRSFSHAITILGMKRLKRWLSLLLTTCNKDNPPALAQTALTRALFLDRLGKDLGLSEAGDDLFLTGAFSLLDRMLGASFDEVFEKVSVSPEVAEAITERTGPYGPMLKLAEACEDRPGGAPVAMVESLALSPADVNRALLAACTAALKTRLED